ncbi:BamA/TamA family outer membrane protein [Mariniflexile ostreae]|uniref:BamA/TamA family outer membrane protein n=1 Tax=Mariniflexile ostreae TaxID=1520892 RepID=A0ABV5FC81_9FLAO
MRKTAFILAFLSVFFSTKVKGQQLQLIIEGENSIENRIIDALGYTTYHSDYEGLHSEIKTFQDQLYSIGYIENRRDSISRINDSLYQTKIQLKTQYHTISIYYPKNKIETSTLTSVSQEVHDDYFVLNLQDVEEALAFINSKLVDKGAPFSKLRLSNISIQDSGHLKAHIIITAESQKRYLDHIIIKGYERFPKSYLKHYLKIKPNKTFSLKAIQKKTEQLNSLAFAHEIKPPEVLFSKDSTTLYMYIEKSASNGFDGFLGFGTNEDSNTLEFDGYVNLSLVNNLNYGERFGLQYKSDQSQQKNFKVDLSLPYLFGSPIGVDLELNIFKKDSSYTTTHQAVNLNYQLNPKHKVAAGIFSVSSNTLLTETSTAAIADYKSVFLKLSYQYTVPQQQHLLFPVHHFVYAEAGTGERKTTTHPEKQFQWTLNTFKIFNLNAKNSVFVKLNAASMASDTYFENELLRFGGINSIRGFEENSILASLYGVLNVEYRLQLSNTIYIHSITDLASFENVLTDAKEKLYGYGLGFGILTRSGLLKFNYANGKSEHTPFKLSNSKIHISLVARF